MSQGGFDQLVHSLLPLVDEAEQSITSERPTQTASEPSVSNSPITPPAESIEQEQAIDLTPKILTISLKEREFISKISTLIPSPRTTKRFINIYRLIRAQLSLIELDAFVGSSGSPGEYRAVILLLAILTGFPRQAPTIFRELYQIHHKLDWQTLIGMMKPLQIPRSEKYSNGLVSSMRAGEAAQWKQLHIKLRAVEGAPEGITAYREWVSRVARFSFQVGRITNQVPLGAEIQITHIDSGASSSDGMYEYVEIENRGETVQSMRGWELSDQANHTFEFPNVTLEPNKVIKVWVGEGENTATDLYWGRKSPVWNNTGERAELRDASGLLISSYTL
jgi:hypothetical protein